MKARYRRAFSAATLFALAPSCAFAAEAARPSNGEVLFRLEHPCPATGRTSGACPGYVIDRIVPLLCGGEEQPANMQWQTLAEAREKDRWERIGCRKGRKLVLPSESVSITESFPLSEPPPAVRPEPLEKRPTTVQR